MLYVCDQLVKFLRHFLVIGYLHGDDIIMPRAIIVFPQASYNSHNSIATLRTHGEHSLLNYYLLELRNLHFSYI